MKEELLKKIKEGLEKEADEERLKIYPAAKYCLNCKNPKKT